MSARDTICIGESGDRWKIGRDHRGRAVAKNLSTGQIVKRKPDYNGRTAVWKESPGGKIVARERSDYRGRTVVNGDTCSYTNRMEYVCK